MTVQAFGEMLARRPFQPVKLTLSSGQSYEIRRPEMAMLTRTSILVGTDLAEGGDLARLPARGTLVAWSVRPSAIRRPDVAVPVARMNRRRNTRCFMATLGYPETGRHIDPAKSVASIIAIIAALVSFYLSSQGSELWALLCALIAIGAGLVGGVKALSPRVSGGILSILAVVLGSIAVIVALIALVV